MAKLSNEDVLKLARLARLQLTDKEVEQFRTEIETILGYVEQLQAIDLSNLEPTSQVTGLKNVMRPDEVYDYATSPQDLLQNAPAVHSGHIKVKRVLE